jgi:uncharacterized protein (DUF885 family)
VDSVICAGTPQQRKQRYAFVMKRLTLFTLYLLSCASLAASADTAAEQLHQLFEQRTAWQMEQFPERAMARGDYSNAHRITDNSLNAIEQRHADTIAHLARLHAIDTSKLNEQDLVNYELFELDLQRSIDSHQHRSFLAPVSGRGGPHQRIAQMAERIRFASVEDYENYLLRLEQTPHMIDNTIALMQLGIEEGRTTPRVVLQGMPMQFHALLDGGGLASLAAPMTRMPRTISAQQRASLQNRFESQTMPMVREAISTFAEFMLETYIPACRESIAAIDWPNGEAYYNHQLQTMTTTDLNAQEIHQIGLSEVARIRAEMMDVIRRSDFMELHDDAASLDDDALFAAFIDYLRTDPRFYHTSEEDLLAGYRAICKEIDGHMPRYFYTLPRLPYGVRPVPRFMAPTQTTAYYSRGDIRNGEAGFFYANTYRLDQRPKYEMIALALHEAVPGHHHQIAIAQEIEDIPEFRRDTWFTAFGEGWALYAERLGIEMGLYEDPYDDFGRLLYEMWRACRLVVDPGMHALGWSREQAIDFMKHNTALSELNITTEIDRYIAWPGQATAYKIGELKIRELRELAEQTLGRRFDLRAFHDVVLGAGAVPLTVLERRINDWIEMQSAP